jgi:hypothetical protein
VLAACGVQLWLPESNGPVDLRDPTHQALMLMLRHQSNREILRARFRTTMAMTAQARDQGRHLGGRPPYGYRLVDAGPHPNAAHARWGRRLHRLGPDPVTAPHVRWIFAQRLAGSSTAAIARALNERRVPCPSRHDPARNPHRHGNTWTLRTVAEILANPRYTGRQVWNRYRTTTKAFRATRGLVRRSVIYRMPSVNGSSPVVAGIRRWSASPTSSRYKQSPPLRDRIPTRPAPTCLPGSYTAAYADAYSTRTGCIAGPGTAAGTATPAPAEKTRTGPRTSTSGKTPQSPTPLFSSASCSTTPNESSTSSEPATRSSSAGRLA